MIFQISLIAAFAAGIVALFAPCCITFLLPAYLGSVFKEKEKVILMTLIFGLGIFVVLLPAVLGVAALSQLFFKYHDPVYIVSSVVLFFVAVFTFLGIKLPMPRLPGTDPGKTDILSIFTLGIVSGITSACCAPVLIGILTLTFLSPNFVGAILIGAMYVLGMVTPLLLISIFLSGKMPAAPFLRKNMATISLFGKKYYLIMSNLIASFVFFVTGWLILVLTLTGRLSMGNIEVFTKTIKDATNFVDKYTGNNLPLNIAFAVVLLYLIYRVSKKI